MKIIYWLFTTFFVIGFAICVIGSIIDIVYMAIGQKRLKAIMQKNKEEGLI